MRSPKFGVLAACFRNANSASTYFSFFGTLILYSLRNFVKQKHKKYALTSVLLLNNLAGAFAREKMTFSEGRLLDFRGDGF